MRRPHLAASWPAVWPASWPASDDGDFPSRYGCMGHSVFGGIMRRDYPLQYPVATPIVRRIRSAVLIHATRHVHELVPPGYCARRCRTGRTLSLPVPTSAMFDRAATAYRLTTMSGRPVTVAVVQAEVAPDLVVALERTAAGVQAARAAGATLVVFPETWVPGYPAWIDLCRDAALWDHTPTKAVFARMARDSVAVPGPAFDALAEIAREAAVTLVVGVSERVESGPGRGTLYNALLTLGPDGRLLNHHRKAVPTYTERLVWGPGDAEGLRAVETPAGRVGGLVCWEHWMPLARQALHESGEDVHVAVWPTAHEMHQVASRQYAFEGRCFVLAAGSLMRASALRPSSRCIPIALLRPASGCCVEAARSSGPTADTSWSRCSMSRACWWRNSTSLACARRA